VDTKKWPIVAQVLIGLGVVGGLMNIGGGLSQKNVISIIFGIIGLTIYWNVYKFKSWALIALNVLLFVNIILSLTGFFFLKGAFLLVCLVTIAYSAFVLVYFNSAKIKGLFRKTETGSSFEAEGKI